LSSLVYVDLNPIRSGIAQTPEQSVYTSVCTRIRQAKDAGDTPLRPLAANIQSELSFVTTEQYLALVDWTGRALALGKRGVIADDTPPILKRLGLRPTQRCLQVPSTESHYWRAIGQLETLMHAATQAGRKWLRRKAAFDTPFGIAGFPAPTKRAEEASAQERQTAYEAKWAEGGSISFLYSYKDLLVNKEANDTASDFVRERIRETVNDPKVAEQLIPYDHPIGTKRLILDTGYYETYNRDNVTLVDVRATPIEQITEDGLRTADGQSYELDAIVFATGFDAMTGALREIDLRNAQGLSIAQKWQDGPRCYLGLVMADFPNLFMITGPQSPSVKAQMILAGEQHTDWIVDCLAHMQTQGHNRIEVEQATEDAWVQHNNEIADSTLYPLANSWYVGANIPGKPRIFMPYVGGFDRFKRTCDEVAAKGYEGIRMSGTKASAAV
jgi:hypothetical protein